MQQPASRAVITDDHLPSGAQVGVTLSGTGYDAYTNVCYTASGTGTSQSWAGSDDVLLSSAAATLYSYYPYSSTVSSDAIPVETASQTDYLYGTPVTGISEAKASTGVTLNHALANLKITVAKGSYAGAGVVSKISVSGAGIATGGTFNAATATPGYTAYSGEDSPVECAVSSSLGSPVDLMVVPTGVSSAVTFTVTVDGTDYTATSSAVALQMGAAYAYTLTLNSSFLAVSSFGVAGWSTGTGGSMVLDKVVTNSGPVVDVTGVANGVYIVTATGRLVDYTTTDATAIGVSLITDKQKIMISKSDATDGTNNTLYWGRNLYNKNVAGITETNSLSVVKTDFAGKANTVAIIKAYTEHSVTMHARDMCSELNTFNAASDGSNAGKNDWYVPAFGQLYEIYTNMTNINTALTNIGGTALAEEYYWSSSEDTSIYAWCVSFGNGSVNYNGKDNGTRVRFVRDIE